MRNTLFALLPLAALFMACVHRPPDTAIKEARSYATLVPQDAPQWSGTYDFDILADVEGRGCATPGEPVSYTIAFVGLQISDAWGLQYQSAAAAAFDALSKVKGADMVLVTRAITEGTVRTQVCTTLYGKAVRLKKGPTAMVNEITGPGPAPAAVPHPVAAPKAPSAAGAPSAGSKSPAVKYCSKDTDCTGALVCKNGRCVP